ncbi:hypothetical protein T440DRAFT_464596 [Plenodomus tracheiphilus IPT5]|uniref:Uncharacterized protein n=1 Tax=Plenodomus tracheiphilus IPT5 TaxID=1408161 RepID=A0A6A7BIV7_9PLEO|nr:hypothetical protein T440DRAFT_464596 [Plenodomus tracheiphilus IPT5]
MLSPEDCSNTYSGLLSLPTEIRCHIYDYLLADSQAITISAAYITALGHRIQDRARKTDIPGLPFDLTPLIRPNRDDSLLSVQHPPTIAIDDAPLQNIDAGPLVYPAPMALRQTCHLVNDELTDYKNMRSKKQPAQARSHNSRTQLYKSEESEEGLSLYVSYPYGILVLKSMYPFLLKQARNVYISGYYTEPPATTNPNNTESFNDHLTPSNSFTIAESFGTRNPSRTRSRSQTNDNFATLSTPSTTPPHPTQRTRLRLDPSNSNRPTTHMTIYPPFHPSTAHHAPTALALLLRTVFSPSSTQPIKFTARILYPGENTYHHVYGSAGSPITYMLRNICGGDIAMVVKRGEAGTGMCFTACPRPESRSVSTCWESWVVGRGSGRAVQKRMRDLDGFLRGV